MRIAIIGGGVAGHLIACKLQHEHQVVLIEPRDHMVIPIAMPRMLVEPALGERALIPYQSFLPKVDHLRGRATAAGPSRVTVHRVDGGEDQVEAEAVVLAMGASYTPDEPALFPAVLERAQRLVRAHALRERLQRAERVLILGGGPVGVEVAAELVTELPHLRLTLMDPGDRLLAGTSARAGRLALHWLRDKGVDVRLGDSVDLPPERRGGPWRGTSQQGHELDVDVALAYYGYRPRLRGLRGLDPEMLDAHGRIRVQPSLQVHGQDRMVAVGDITDLNERKLAMYAARHADVAAATLSALARGERPTATYTPATGDQTMLVTLGRHDGVCHLPVVGAMRVPWLARRLKSADVMVSKYRRRIGLPARS